MLTKVSKTTSAKFMVVTPGGLGDQSARVPRTLVHEMLASDHMFGGSGLSSPPSPPSTLALFSFFHFILLYSDMLAMFDEDLLQLSEFGRIYFPWFEDLFA